MSSLEFELTRQFGGQGIEKVIARFCEEKDAREFTQAKAGWAHQTKVKSVYRLYHESEVILEINTDQDIQTGTGTSTGASTGSGSQSRSPSPFSTTPQPAGPKSSYLPKDNDDADEDI